jgi:hypothetical protein
VAVAQLIGHTTRSDNELSVVESIAQTGREIGCMGGSAWPSW